MRWSAVIVAAAVCVVGACGPDTDQSSAGTEMRPDESRFIATKVAAEADYDGSVNDIQRQQAKAAWEKSVCTAVSSPRFVNWSGTIQSILAKGMLGGPGLIVDLGNGISLEATVDEASPVYKSISSMAEGAPATFTGSFVAGDDGCPVDLIGWPWGDSRIKKPEFDVRFESIVSP